jgi:uncharacterized membrane protein
MGYLRWLTGEVYGVVQINGGWMAWNLILAFVPALLAIPLLWRPHRRTAAWWTGIAVFVLFLPNAPYVVTDLIHIRFNAGLAESDAVLVAGVLPLFAIFVLLGMGSYVFCMEAILREARSVRPGVARWMVELPVHAICALGIVLGRIARLNTWDTITEPVGTAETVFATLTWRGAPAAFVAIFIAIWLAFTVVRVLVVAAGSWGRSVIERFSRTGTALAIDDAAP